MVVLVACSIAVFSAPWLLEPSSYRGQDFHPLPAHPLQWTVKSDYGCFMGSFALVYRFFP